jgi:hypothetical protein
MWAEVESWKRMSARIENEGTKKRKKERMRAERSGFDGEWGQKKSL